MMEAEVESIVQLRANKKTQRICNATADARKQVREANEIAVRKFRPQGRDGGHEAKSWKRVFGEESLKERREGRMKDA